MSFSTIIIYLFIWLYRTLWHVGAWSGMEPMPPWKLRVLTTGPPGKPRILHVFGWIGALFLLLGFSIEVQSLSLTSISKVFQNDCTNLYFHQQYVSLLHQLHVVFFFFILTILMTWIGFTVVLIPWLLMKFSSFSCVNWPFRYALLWSAYSSLLTIFLLDCLTFFLLT